MKSKQWLEKIDKDWTLFLDRDGTINKRIPGYVTRWDQFSFLPETPQSIANCNHLFGRVFIITNQQGIGKELMTHDDLEVIHEKMIEVFDYFQAHIDAIYYDPTLAVYDSYYRKPNPGMGKKAKEEYPDIDFKKSVMVGDTFNDILFGAQLGMKTVWIENEWENGDRAQIMEICDLIVPSLHEFAQYIY